MAATTLTPHCGVCYQCIDRMFATACARLSEQDDPQEQYAFGLLTTNRPNSPDRQMPELFVQRANKLNGINEVSLLSDFGEVSRALRHLGMSPSDGARKLAELHRQHAAEVLTVLADGVKAHSAAFFSNQLPPDCLLMLACPNNTKPAHLFRQIGSSWELAFQGEISHIRNTTGARYLARLLASPNRGLTCDDLSGVPFRATGSGQAVTDRAGRMKARQRLEKLKAAHAAAEATGKRGIAKAAALEAKKLEQQMARDAGLGNRSRTFRDDAGRTRDRVHKALHRAIAEIETTMPSFASHLLKCLGFADECAYRPTAEITWILT